MPSGKFALIDVDSITIDRATRQRREIDNIEDLARSISQRGLINPIVITKDLELIAGERRLTAVRSLGHTKIAVQFAEDLSRRELRLIELEENTKRSDLPWIDQVKAVAELHELYVEETPDWKVKDTAESLGLHQKHIAQLLHVKEEVDSGNVAVSDAGKLSTAIAATQRARLRRKDDIVNSIIEPTQPINQIPLYNADTIEWLKTYTGEPFNLIHCDFPYGINFNKGDRQNSANMETYDDSFETYQHLVEYLLPAIPIDKQCHLIFWFSMHHFEWTKLQLIKQGWAVNPFPLYWFKSDHKGLMPDPNRAPRRVVETAFLASKGDRLLVRSTSDCYSGVRGEVTHASTKPRDMLAHFLRMLVDSSTVMIDPTSGSGNAVKVAKTLGARFAVGVELDPIFHADALREWDKE